jgi:hypothetical protein
MLSQIEQARTNPSVATICRLATASTSPSPAWSRPRGAERPGGAGRGGGHALDRGARRQHGPAAGRLGTSQQVELWDVRMLAGDGYASEGHPAGTRELLLVIEGELTLELDGRPPSGLCRATPSRSWPTAPTPTATTGPRPCATRSASSTATSQPGRSPCPRRLAHLASNASFLQGRVVLRRRGQVAVSSSRRSSPASRPAALVVEPGTGVGAHGVTSRPLPCPRGTAAQTASAGLWAAP